MIYCMIEIGNYESTTHHKGNDKGKNSEIFPRKEA